MDQIKAQASAYDKEATRNKRADALDKAVRVAMSRGGQESSAVTTARAKAYAGFLDSGEASTE